MHDDSVYEYNMILADSKRFDVCVRKYRLQYTIITVPYILNIRYNNIIIIIQVIQRYNIFIMIITYVKTELCTRVYD